MTRSDLTSIPGIGKRRAELLGRSLAIRSLLDLVLADREAVRRALGSGRTPAPTLEDIAGWQDEARRRRMTDEDSSWRRAASFVVTFEEMEDPSDGTRRQTVIEQAESGPEPASLVTPGWDSGLIGGWIRAHLPEEDEGDVPEPVSERSAAGRMRITRVEAPGVPDAPERDGLIAVPQPGVIAVSVDPGAATEVSVTAALLDTGSGRMSRVLGSGLAEAGHDVLIQISDLEPGRHRVLLAAADPDASTGPDSATIEVEAIEAGRPRPGPLDPPAPVVPRFSKRLPHDAASALPAPGVAFPPTRAEVRGSGYSLTAPIFDPGTTEPAHSIAPPPTGRALLVEMLELQWMALLRDEALDQIDDGELASLARAELTAQGLAPGVLGVGLDAGHGDSVSPLLLGPVRYGKGITIELLVPGIAAPAHGVTTASAFAMQTGPAPAPPAAPTARRPIGTGGDLAQFVWDEPQVLQWLHAVQRLWGMVAVGGPLAGQGRLLPFVRFAPTEIVSALAGIVLRALVGAMEHKWVYRAIRPEELGVRLAAGEADAEILRETDGARRAIERWGSLLLPQVYPEGCPAHPAYPAGHAAAAGAAATLMKMVFDEAPLPGHAGWTVYDAIDQLAFNVAAGRAWAGVHFRSDNLAGLLFGEAVAEQQGPSLLPGWGTLEWRRFDGSHGAEHG